jgi:hypothetical protein
VLETLLMALIRLTGGRLAEVFFGVGYDGSATVCTSDDIFVAIVGFPGQIEPPKAPAPVHIHYRLRVWSKGGHATTILSTSGTRAREVMTFELDSKGPYVLDPSGAPVKVAFTLRPVPKGAPLPYSVGETVPFELHMSRGWVKKCGLPLEAEKE